MTILMKPRLLPQYRVREFQPGIFRVERGNDLAYVEYYFNGMDGFRCADCEIAITETRMRAVNECKHIDAVRASDPVRFADVR